MAYPYDDYGELTDRARDDLWDELVKIAEGSDNWNDTIDRFFDYGHEKYPDIEDYDLWDVFREYYLSVTT